MGKELFSVDEVATHLQLHVKTVRSFVREGRLKATRVGKQYRIARADLEAFTGQPIADAAATAARHRFVEASSVVQIEAIDRDCANRVTNTLISASNGRGEGDQPLRVESFYDEERARLKIIIVGSIASTAELCRLIDVLVGKESAQ